MTSFRKGSRQLSNHVAYPADLAVRQRPVLGGQKKNTLRCDLECSELSGEVELLTQHVRSHQYYTVRGYTKPALAILIMIDTDARAILDDRPAVDDGTFDAAATADLDLGKQH